MAMERKGYDKDFLGNGFTIAMPEIGLEHQSDVLTNPDFRDGHVVDYVHFSVAMNKANRQAFFSAANIDQTQYQENITTREWFIDPRVGVDFQIGPDAYLRNCWDRGHLTRRADVTWGDTYEARFGSNDSCSYANASPQHENFNQDEWTVPEDIIHDLKITLNHRLMVFTGPVFTSTDRWYNRPGIQYPVRIPSAFWKAVCYIDKDSKRIACQAFMMFQDDLFIADKRGKEKLDISSYQVTITEIESHTGLTFDKQLYDANPLYFFPREGINKGPEAYLSPSRKEGGIPLSDGLVFSRADTEKSNFAQRKREIDFDRFKSLNGFHNPNSLGKSAVSG